MYKFPSSHSGKTLFDRGRNVLMGEMIRDYWPDYRRRVASRTDLVEPYRTSRGKTRDPRA